MFGCCLENYNYPESLPVDRNKCSEIVGGFGFPFTTRACDVVCQPMASVGDLIMLSKAAVLSGFCVLVIPLIGPSVKIT